MNTQMEAWWFMVILPGLLLASAAILWGIVAHYVLRNVEMRVTYTRGRMRCPGCGGARVHREDLARVLCYGCGTVSDMYDAIKAGEEETDE